MKPILRALGTGFLWVCTFLLVLGKTDRADSLSDFLQDMVEPLMLGLVVGVFIYLVRRVRELKAAAQP